MTPPATFLTGDGHNKFLISPIAGLATLALLAFVPDYSRHPRASVENRKPPNGEPLALPVTSFTTISQIGHSPPP
jgi:hypothetical protein